MQGLKNISLISIIIIFLVIVVILTIPESSNRAYFRSLEIEEKEIISPDKLEEIENEEAFDETKGVNKPELMYFPEATTYAITYDGSNNPSAIPLSQAKTDTTWYDYGIGKKKWANIKTTNNGNDAYWVWIPRYAYKIDTPHTNIAQTINIKFLIGTSNITADGTELPEGYIVHPAFMFGDKELTGLWVAKFEASSNAPNKVEESFYTGGGNDTSLQVRVLPSVYSWRNISTGNAQKVCMNMTSGSGSIGTTEGTDTHQMKNIEWGAVTYLTQSIYGKNSEVWINPYGDTTTYKMKTGYAGGEVSSMALAEGSASLAEYNSGNGPNASTTGNVYGIYDMSGGAWEYVAAYIDNGNISIGRDGTSAYFTNNKIKEGYEKYYDIYEPGNHEKLGGIYFGSGITPLWNGDNSLANNTLRKALTDMTYAKLANKKGDALYETSSSTEINYYGKDSSNVYTWLKSETDTSTSYATGWNNDYQLYGYGNSPWTKRGGAFYNGSNAGQNAVSYNEGTTYMNCGFRPVLIVGDTL